MSMVLLLPTSKVVVMTQLWSVIIDYYQVTSLYSEHCVSPRHSACVIVMKTIMLIIV